MTLYELLTYCDSRQSPPTVSNSYHTLPLCFLGTFLEKQAFKVQSLNTGRLFTSLVQSSLA